MKYTLAIAAAALLLAAEAACPNQCSGHGFCDENDRCICYKTPGLKGLYRDAWTGADCSLRVCPYADAYDIIVDNTQELYNVNYAKTVGGPTDVGFIPSSASSKHKLVAYVNNGFLYPRDFGIDVRVVSVDTSVRSAQFQWKLSSQRTFNAEVTVSSSQYSDRSRSYHLTTDYNGDGVVDPSGLYVYWSVTDADFTAGTQTVFANDRYYLNVTYNQGKFALLVDQNTVHPTIECAGRGICDRTKGECQCFAGYTGDGCQRTTCPNACSGHGTCQNLRNFVEDGTNGVNSYSGVDATQMMGCKCDPGYRGADCSLVECPSGPDPMGGDGGAQGQDCSGRGICDYTAGTCQCFKGFAGERCESATTLI